MRGLLDAYAGIHTAPTAPALDHDWRQARQALEHAQRAKRNCQHERERLQWHIDELDKLPPKPKSGKSSTPNTPAWPMPKPCWKQRNTPGRPE